MDNLIVEEGKAVLLSEEEALLIQKQEEAKELSKEQDIYKDVSAVINMANSKLGYVLPKSSNVVQEVSWKDVNYKALEGYNNEMDKLSVRFQDLKEGKQAKKYTDAYIHQEVKDIQEKAKVYLKLVKFDIDEMKQITYNEPTVKERIGGFSNAQEQALNKANTIALIQSVLSTNDLELVHALLEENIHNNEVRFLVSHYLTAQKKNKDTKRVEKAVVMLNGIKEFENKLKNMEQLKEIEFKYEKIAKTISHSEEYRDVFPKFNIDEKSFLKEKYDFSLRQLKSL